MDALNVFSNARTRSESPATNRYSATIISVVRVNRGTVHKCHPEPAARRAAPKTKIVRESIPGVPFDAGIFPILVLSALDMGTPYDELSRSVVFTHLHDVPQDGTVDGTAPDLHHWFGTEFDLLPETGT